MWLRTALLSLLICILLDFVESQDWAHHTILDGGIYHLYWNSPNNKTADSKITLKLEVNTQGYVALGFSPNGGMPGSDIVTGWIKDGEIYFQDRHAVAFSLPPKDDQQDYELIDAYENDTSTVFVFSRKLDTCDKDDWVIGDSTIRMIYAYSEEDPTGDDPFYHDENRGVKSVLLLQNNDMKHSNLDLDSMSQWDVLSPDVNFSSSDTLYWCKIYKSPQVSEKHHILRIEHVIEDREFVHHLLLFECVGGTHEEYEIYVDDKGYECYKDDMPERMYRCQGVTAIWTVGAHDIEFEEHIGMPIDAGPPKYYMLETHYNNPRRLTRKTDSSGFRFYHTKYVRKYDLGLMITGASISPRSFIPPRQDKYIVVGHTNPECFTKFFPKGGAKGVAIFLHAHLIARGIKVRHFRNNEELEPLYDDKYYDFNYQSFRFFGKEITVLPTDQLAVECTYNSSERTKVTHGGFSTTDEMCDIFLLYYPRVEQSVAFSASTYDNINMVLNLDVTNDKELDHLLDSYDWDSVDIDVVQKVMRYAKHETECYYLGPYQVDQTNKSMISYPSVFTPYEPPPTCNDY